MISITTLSFLNRLKRRRRMKVACVKEAHKHELTRAQKGDDEGV